MYESIISFSASIYVVKFHFVSQKNSGKCERGKYSGPTDSALKGSDP